MIYVLTSLRFIFAIGIYFHHLNYNLGIGPIAVTFFFILSGFVMAYGYKDKFKQINISIYKKFMLDRISRLYPMHVLAFLVSIYVMYLIKFEINFINALMHLFLVQTYSNIGIQVFYFSGLSWFLADCIFLYAITPFALFLLHKIKAINKIYLLLIFEAIILFGGFMVAYMLKGNFEGYSTKWWFIYISPYYRLFDYAAGFIAGILFTLVKDKINKCNIFIFSILEIGVIYLGYKLYISSLIQIASIRMDIFYAPIIIILIFIFAFQGGILSKVLSLKGFVHLGELSFPIFMIHQLVITLAAHLFRSNIYEPGGRTHFLAQILLFVAIICISDVLNRYYEIPMKKWIISLNRRTRKNQIEVSS